MSSARIGIPAGNPSTVTTRAGPWDSPAVKKRSTACSGHRMFGWRCRNSYGTRRRETGPFGPRLPAGAGDQLLLSVLVCELPLAGVAPVPVVAVPVAVVVPAAAVTGGSSNIRAEIVTVSCEAPLNGPVDWPAPTLPPSRPPSPRRRCSCRSFRPS